MTENMQARRAQSRQAVVVRCCLKTSDGEYHLPVNESRLNNHLHGWIHKREHNVEKIYSDEEKAVAVTSFTHDENDGMFSYFPIKFKLTYTFELSEKGLLQSIVLENLSEKYLPVSLCTHTCINSPIVCGGKQSRLRLSVPIEERCELNDRFLPTERLLSLDTHDMRYKKGVMKPVLHSISNDMYTAGENVLNGNPFNGVIITDLENGRKICNEVSKEFKFWNIWNDKGYNGYFCPEPMTAMINSPNLSLPPEISGYSELAPGEKYSCWQRFFTL